MGIYEELGLSRIINAAASLTSLGGSIMHPSVVEAMTEASRSFVDMHELQGAVGKEIAKLTRNEAAWVTAGGSAAITLTLLAARTGTDEVSIARLPNHSTLKGEVVMLTAHRNPYDEAVKLAGCTLVTAGNIKQTLPGEFEAALSDQTAAILYLAGPSFERGSLPLPQVVSIAGQYGIPVIVDAAAQVPPKENFWYFTEELGADAAIFSGGKQLGGPQSTGLVVGKQQLIEAVKLNAPPNQRYARALKVGKEEIIGLYRALRNFFEQDHAVRYEELFALCRQWQSVVAEQSGFSAEILALNVSGAAWPRLKITLPSGNAAEVKAQLWSLEPKIAVHSDSPHALYLEPEHLAEEEHQYVIDSLVETLNGVK